MGRKQQNALERGIGQTATPVFLLAPDRRILLFNAGCELLTGWASADVVGQVCQYASVADPATPAAVAASLCPPPEVLAGREMSVATYVVTQQGDSLPRTLHFFPLCDPEQSLTGVLGVIALIPPAAPVAPGSPARMLHAELADLRGRLRARFGAQTLVGNSGPMARVLNQVELALHSTVFVCLEGEPGIGKEHLARVMHYAGAQRGSLFVPLECRKLPAEELQRILTRLLDLHRHPAGGRTQSGTLYLADVDALPRDLQDELALAFCAVPPEARPALRLISGTTTSLDAAAAQDLFRPDLHALLTTLTIVLPRLRDRGADLPVLAQHFLEEANRQGEKQVAGFADEVWPAFARYHWPGNLDELNLVIREAHGRSAEPQIRLADLPFRFHAGLAAQDSPPPLMPRPLPLDELLTRTETSLIQLALERSKFNKSQAAEILGVNRARLYRRMEQLGIEDRETGETA